MPMTDGWVEPECSKELLVAVGRLALAFAALDIGLAMTLSHSSEADFPKICKQPLTTKLANLKRKRGRRQELKLIPLCRIDCVARLRNDLMHGVAFISVYPSVGDLDVWNPARQGRHIPA